MYPETTFSTPFSCWKMASVHQKQPLAKVAISSPAVLSVMVGFGLGWLHASRGSNTMNVLIILIVILTKQGIEKFNKSGIKVGRKTKANFLLASIHPCGPDLIWPDYQELALIVNRLYGYVLEWPCYRLSSGPRSQSSYLSR